MSISLLDVEGMRLAYRYSCSRVHASAARRRSVLEYFSIGEIFFIKSI
jgi:hypothetical protein